MASLFNNFKVRATQHQPDGYQPIPSPKCGQKQRRPHSSQAHPSTPQARRVGAPSQARVCDQNVVLDSDHFPAPREPTPSFGRPARVAAAQTCRPGQPAPAAAPYRRLCLDFGSKLKTLFSRPAALHQRQAQTQGAVELTDLPSSTARRQGMTGLAASPQSGRRSAVRSSHDYPTAPSSLTEPLLSEAPCQSPDETVLLISSPGRAGTWVVVHHATQRCSVPDEPLKPFQWSQNRHLLLTSQQPTSSIARMQSAPSAACLPAHADQHASAATQRSSHAEPRSVGMQQQQDVAAQPQRAYSAPAHTPQLRKGKRGKVKCLRWSKRGVVRHQPSQNLSHAHNAAPWMAGAHAGLAFNLPDISGTSTAGQVWNDPYPCSSGNSAGQSTDGSAMPRIRMQTVLMQRAPVQASLNLHMPQLFAVATAHQAGQVWNNPYPCSNSNSNGQSSSSSAMPPIRTQTVQTQRVPWPAIAPSSQAQQASMSQNTYQQARTYAAKSRWLPGHHKAASTGQLRTSTEAAIWAAAARLAGSGPLFSL